MALTSGTKLGPYEIQTPLGAGGMGEVYRALDTRLDRAVAIKILASHLSSSPELKQRMEREGRATSSLNHPHNGGLQFGAAQPVATTPATQQFVYDVMPDGKKILLNVVSQQVNQLVTVVTNFTAGLKR